MDSEQTAFGAAVYSSSLNAFEIINVTREAKFAAHGFVASLLNTRNRSVQDPLTFAFCQCFILKSAESHFSKRIKKK